jgi:hypothetical protein
MTDVERDRDPDGAFFFTGGAFVGRETLAVAKCASAGVATAFLLLGAGLGFVTTEVEAGVAFVFGLHSSQYQENVV